MKLVQLCLFFLCASSSTFTMVHLLDHIRTLKQFTKHTNTVLFFIKILYSNSYIMEGCYLLSASYFLKIMLLSTYEEEYFKINKKYLNVWFWIFMASTIYSEISNVVVIWLDYQILMDIFGISMIEFIFVLMLYLSMIMYYFNSRLRMFLSLNTNEILSANLDNKLKHYVIKQTTLISIITLSAFVYVIITIYYEYSLSDTAALFMYFTYCLWALITAVTLYLTININSKQYTLVCNHCHYSFIYLCTKAQRKHTADVNQRLLLVKGNVGFPKYGAISHNNATCLMNVDECTAVERIYKLLQKHEYDNSHGTNTVENYMQTIKYEISNIFNDFNHLLLWHDSEKQFNEIYTKINGNDHNKNSTNCSIFSRSNRRRSSRPNEYTIHTQTTSTCLATNVLDKIHSFYFHSYDTFLRMKYKNTYSSESEKIQHNLSELSKNTNNYNTSNNSTYNKFNTSLTSNKDNDIYSFGQRFVYSARDDEKKEWSIKPKCLNVKQELIDNDSCNISIADYQLIMDKCTHNMNTDHVKSMQNRNKEVLLILTGDHILSLLVYCNCDEYQYKWSSTFRRIKEETNKSLKCRHSYFYHCSKYLREL
eukprot:252596_1